MLSKMASLFDALSKAEVFIHKLLEKLVSLFMLILVVDVIYQVFYRILIVKFFTIPSMFTEELARYLVIWVMFLLLPVCLKEGRFSAVTLIVFKVQPRLRMALYTLVQLLSVILYIVTFKYSFSVIRSNMFFKSPSMGLPGVFIYSSIAVGLGMCVFQIAIECLGVYSGRLRPFYNFESAEGKGGAS